MADATNNNKTTETGEGFAEKSKSPCELREDELEAVSGGHTAGGFQTQEYRGYPLKGHNPNDLIMPNVRTG